MGPLPSIGAAGLWTYLPWFTVGLFVSGLARTRSPASLVPLLMAFSVIGAAAWALTYIGAGPPRLSTFAEAGIGIGLCLVAAIYWSAAGVLRQVGQASLTIYLLHTFCSAGIRELFDALYPLNPLLLLGLTTVAGIALPFAAYLLAVRFGLSTYLGFGRIAGPAPPESASAIPPLGASAASVDHLA
jgi:hypothetical protein